MRNLTLRTDWNDCVLFDDYEAAEVDAGRISADMRRELSAWNAAYRQLLSCSSPNSASAEVRIAELDARGRALAAALKPLFPDTVIRYAGDAGGPGGVV